VDETAEPAGSHAGSTAASAETAFQQDVQQQVPFLNGNDPPRRHAGTRVFTTTSMDARPKSVSSFPLLASEVTSRHALRPGRARRTRVTVSGPRRDAGHVARIKCPAVPGKGPSTAQPCRAVIRMGAFGVCHDSGASGGEWRKYFYTADVAIDTTKAPALNGLVNRREGFAERGPRSESLRVALHGAILNHPPISNAQSVP